MSTGALLLLLASCAPPDGRPRIAEVYYDAPGDDSGLEFVELFHAGGAAWPLAGLRLEAGDGSAPARWTLRWTAGPGDTIRPGGRFVIGGARVVPPADAAAVLDLQNGPDAVRLVWPDGRAEVLGYGVHEFVEYFCGEPAADAAAGQSLARVPDDADGGGNAADFRPAAPSPGRANRARRDAAWVAGSLALDPAHPEAGAMATLRGGVANLGSEPVAAGGVAVVVWMGGAPAARAVVGEPLAPGESLAVAVPLALPAGDHRLHAMVELAGDESPGNDLDSLRVRAGPGPLEITEIQFHPSRGEGEWVEFRNRSPGPVDPGGFTLSDRGASRGRPDWPGPPLPAGAYAVFAQDRAALLAAHAGLDSGRVADVRPWPSLNNTDDASGFADAVVLRESDGVPCDRQDYSGAGVPSGVPVELAPGGGWRPALDPAGSPLAPAREPPPLAGSFDVRPARLEPGGDARVAWALPWLRARLAVDIYDLAGDRVGAAMAEMAVSGRGERVWYAGALAPGLYVLRMRARPEGGSGAAEIGASRVVRVAGAAR
jgi:hypothetical protein